MGGGGEETPSCFTRTTTLLIGILDSVGAPIVLVTNIKTQRALTRFSQLVLICFSASEDINLIKQNGMNKLQ